MPDTTLTLKADAADLQAKLKATTALIEELSTEIAELKADGNPTEELEQGLDKLKDAAYDTEQALKLNREELAKRRQEELNAARATRENTKEQEGLFGALSKGQKALAGGVAAILAFREAYNKTRSTIKFFKDQFGIDIDEMVTKSLGLETIAERLVGLGDKSKQAAEDQERLRNMINVLDNLGIKHAGTIEDVTQKYDAWAKGHQKVVSATEQNNAAFEKFSKTVAGFSLDELNGELDDLVAIGARLQAEGKFNEGPFADAFRERVKKATDALEALGTKGISADLLNRFTTLRDSMTQTANATDQLAASQQQLAKDAAAVITELEKQTQSLEKARQGIDDLANDAGDSLSRLIGKFEELSDSQEPERVVQLKDQITLLTEEYDALGDAVVTTQENEDRRIAILEQIDRLTAQIARAQAEAASEFVQGSKAQREAQAEFARLLAEYESDIRNLPEEVRPALQSLVNEFKFTNEHVRLGARDIQEFKTKWVAELIIAGRTVDGFADQTAAAMSKAQSSAEATADAIGVAWDGATAHADGYLAKLNEIIERQQLVAAGIPSIADAAEEAF
jgi:DNA repair exonuclease SbcCD ATPase subunit